jgi:hypothetical protein
MSRDPLPVEMLASADARRVSVEDHRRFRESLTVESSGVDDIDEAVADPILDHIPQRRNKASASRVLRILDELKQGGTSR